MYPTQHGSRAGHHQPWRLSSRTLGNACNRRRRPSPDMKASTALARSARPWTHYAMTPTSS